MSISSVSLPQTSHSPKLVRARLMYRLDTVLGRESLIGSVNGGGRGQCSRTCTRKYTVQGYEIDKRQRKFRVSVPHLANNKEKALHCLKFDSQYQARYETFIPNVLNKGYAERVPAIETV